MACADLFTPRQRQLIADCRAMGFGYAKFATNVQNQGWCSPKQEAAMEKMKADVASRQASYARSTIYTAGNAITDQCGGPVWDVDDYLDSFAEP